jgi:hypothetical protein
MKGSNSLALSDDVRAPQAHDRARGVRKSVCRTHEIANATRRPRAHAERADTQENGTVYHTYTVTAPDPFVAPFFGFLLERTPKPQSEIPLTYRKDEYPDGA